MRQRQVRQRTRVARAQVARLHERLDRLTQHFLARFHLVGARLLREPQKPRAAVERLDPAVAVGSGNLHQSGVAVNEMPTDSPIPVLGGRDEPLEVRSRVDGPVELPQQFGEVRPKHRLIRVPVHVRFEVRRGGGLLAALEALGGERQRVVVWLDLSGEFGRRWAEECVTSRGKRE